MKPFNQETNLLDQFFEFAISWANQIKKNWHPTHYETTPPTSLKDLPKNVKRYLEFGERFPFLNIGLHPEWISNEYFILAWRIGLKKVGDSWKIWNHEYRSEGEGLTPTPLQPIKSEIELVLLELGLKSLLGRPWCIEQKAWENCRWVRSELPKILSKIFQESKLIYTSKVSNLHGFNDLSPSVIQWRWHEDGMILEHGYVPEEDGEYLQVGVTSPKVHNMLVDAGSSPFHGILAPG